jgi:hypothetical protein
VSYRKVLLLQIIGAAVCSAGIILNFAIGFAFGDAGVTPPLGWSITYGAMIGVVLLIGLGLGFACRPFPWLALVMIPIMMRAIMLRPLQMDLWGGALLLGGYTDLLFVIGAGIGTGLFHLRRRRRASL